MRTRVTVGTTAVLALALAALAATVAVTTRADLLRGTEAILAVAVQRDLAGGPQGPPPRIGDSSGPSAGQATPGAGGGSTVPTGDARGLPSAHLVIGADDRVVAEEGSGPTASPDPLPVLTPVDLVLLRAGQAVVVGSQDPGLRYLALAGARDDGVLEVEAAPLDDVDAALTALAWRLLLGGLVVLLAAGAATVLLVRHDMRPLDGVVAVADSVAAGRRDLRIPADRGPTEIRRLSASLDQMLVRQQAAMASLQAGDARMRRFVSDASHELQTPITSVRGWVQLCLEGSLDPQEVREALTHIDREGRRMSVLVEQLLLLARLDEARTPAATRVDLGEVAREAVADAAVIDPDRPLEVRADPGVLVLGDRDHLRRVVDNLLRNIRQHTPPGTAGRVRVRCDGDDAVLAVRDHGGGLDEQAMAHAFDRFWRGDGSRVRRTGGAGLGLSVSAALAASMSGSLVAANDPDGGAVFTLRLPRAPTAESLTASDE